MSTLPLSLQSLQTQRFQMADRVIRRCLRHLAYLSTNMLHGKQIMSLVFAH